MGATSTRCQTDAIANACRYHRPMPRRPTLFVLTAGLAAGFAVGAGIARDVPTLLVLTALAFVNGFVCRRYAA